MMIIYTENLKLAIKYFFHTSHNFFNTDAGIFYKFYLFYFTFDLNLRGE